MAFHVFGRFDSTCSTIYTPAARSIYRRPDNANNQTIDQTVHADYRHASNEYLIRNNRVAESLTMCPHGLSAVVRFSGDIVGSARISILFWLPSIHGRNLMAIWMALRWMGDFYRFEQLVGSKHQTIRSPQISFALTAERRHRRKITFIKSFVSSILWRLLLLSVAPENTRCNYTYIIIHSTQRMGMAGHNRAGKNGT